MTQSFIPSDFFQNIIASSTSEAVDLLRSVFAVFWTSFQPYFPYAVTILFVLLIIASIKAMLGQTGMLGSLFYHIFFFTILGIIIWIKGLEVLLSPFFNLIGFILYRVCYWLTGMILERFRHH